MSKTRKILSIVLALAMMVSTFAVSAFAITVSYESEDNAGLYNQTWALSEPVDNGDGTFTIDVSLTTDYLTGAIQFVLTNTDATAVQFAPEDLELEEIAKRAVLGEAIPEDYNAEISAEETVYKDANGNVTTSRVKVMIIPSSNGVESITAEPIDGVIASITYTLVDGSADITLVDDAASETNRDGYLIAARVSDGNIVTGDAIVGQTVVIDNGTVTIGSSALPSDLAKKATAEAGIIIDTAKTFGGQYAGVVYGFTQAANNTFASTTYLTNNLEATNGGSLSFKNTIGTRGYSTGTEITVTGLDGNSKKYVVVIFGDVNSDCVINGNDLKAIQTAIKVSTTYANNSVQRMAANCQIIAMPAMMHTINGNDLKAVQAHIKNSPKLDQAALATRMSTLTTNYT